MATERQQLIWIWGAMIARCYNKKNKQFHDYGGRGITVSNEWRSFRNFFDDVSPRPDGMTLDRKRNDEGYSKDNFRWASYQAQSLNKRIYKSNKVGVSGVEIRPETGNFRVRIRRKGRLVINKTTDDFFEAACVAISFRNQYSYLSGK